MSKKEKRKRRAAARAHPRVLPDDIPAHRNNNFEFGK